MLDYIGLGERRYGTHPTALHRRSNWEFQGIVAGRAAPETMAEGRLPLRGAALWVSGPGSTHGWYGDPGERCEVAVTQFDQVPDEIRKRVGGRARLVIPLIDDDAAWLRSLVEAIVPDYRQPTTFSRLRVDRLLLELSVFALRHEPEQLVPRNEDYARSKVAAAKAWYSTHMEQCPSVEMVAEAVYVSPSHLRRLFKQAGAGSPRGVLRELQIARVKQLLLTVQSPLSEVASMCGFSAQSDLSRVFKAAEGVSPSHWQAGRQRGAGVVNRGSNAAV